MNTPSQGDPRPTSVSRSAIEKRLKRHLAKSGFSLVKSRPGTRQHDALGDYSIFDTDHELIAEKIDLVTRARAYGLMTHDEELSDSTVRNLTVGMPTKITGKGGKKRTERNLSVETPATITGKASTTTTNGMPTSAWEKLEGALLCLESAAMALEDVVRGRAKAEPLYLVSIAYTVETALAQIGHARHELEEVTQ